MPSRVNISVRVNRGEVYGAVHSPDVQSGMDDLARSALSMQRVLCPVDTGKLSRSLTIRKTPNGGRDVGSFGVDYAAPVEDGHTTRAGTWVPPQPFIRPALDAVRARLGRN